jgi:hypothetical protein
MQEGETSEELVMEPTMEAGVAVLSGDKPLGAVVQIDDGQRTSTRWFERR